MSLFAKEKAQALLTLLQNAHAEQYTGLDDDMSDDCNEWISGLTEDDIGTIVVEVFRNGI
jgi:hypothetical protein